MDFYRWEYFDTAIALIQIIIVMYFGFRWRGRIGTQAAITLELCAWFFISPADFAVNFNTPLLIYDPRFIPWVPFLPWNLSINNLIIIVYILYVLLLYFIKKNLRIDRWLLIFFIAVILGNFGAFFSILKVDFHTLFSADKIFLLIIATALGLKSMNNNKAYDSSWYIQFLWLLFIVSFMSTISMFLLSPDLRDSRDWGYAIIQSQYSPTVFTVLFILAIFKKLKRWQSVIAILTVIIVGFFGHYKSVMLILPSILLIRIFSPLLRLMAKSVINNILFFLMLFSPVIVVLLFYRSVPAFSTRAFQILNAFTSLYKNGIFTQFFGLGWDQWYYIYFPFKFVDYYAWNHIQLVNEHYKYSIQTSGMSILLDSGILGSLSFISSAYMLYLKTIKCNRFGYLATVLIAGLMVNILFLFPNIAPEGAMLVVILLTGSCLNGKPNNEMIK